jgi:hypothetical protein
LPFYLWDAVNLEEKSEEMVLDEDTDNGDASIAEVSRPATTPAAKPKNNTSNDTKTDMNVDEAAEAATVEGTPDPSAANTRRGLRNRKPAQQRPYYHDAQLFEDAETEPEEENSRQSSPSGPPPPPRKPTPPPKEDILMGLWDALTTEADELYKQQSPDRPNDPDKHRNVDDEPELELESGPPKAKHF